MRKVSKPVFSVIIPCYNVEDSILQTLECLKNQTFKNFEVILINDGSIDNTLDILENFYLDQDKKIVNQLNKGLGAARNAGIKESNGEFIALLDADDLWFDEKLEKVYNFIIKNNSVVVCHNEYVVNSKNELLKKSFYGPHTKFEDLFFNHNCLSPSAVTMKKSILDKIGLFTENIKLHGVEDYDLWLRMGLDNINIDYFADFLGSYVIHGDNMSTEYKFFKRIEYLYILYKKHINLDNKNSVIKYKMKFFRIYISKIRLAISSRMIGETFEIIKDISLLFLSLEKFIIKKQIELRD